MQQAKKIAKNKSKKTKKTENLQKTACKNCAKLHHKCDKKLPSCTSCIRKRIPCELNPSTKKRGRPFGKPIKKMELESQKRTKSESEATIVETKEINSPFDSLDKNMKLKAPISFQWNSGECLEDQFFGPIDNFNIETPQFSFEEIDFDKLNTFLIDPELSFN